MLKKSLAILFLNFLAITALPGCSVYRSDGRDQMENEVPKKVADSKKQLSLLGCKTEGRLESWLQEEFPEQIYTLEMSEPDLEIWTTSFPPEIEVRALKKINTSTKVCVYRFLNEDAWNSFKQKNSYQDLIL